MSVLAIVMLWANAQHTLGTAKFDPCQYNGDRLSSSLRRICQITGFIILGRHF